MVRSPRLGAAATGRRGTGAPARRSHHAFGYHAVTIGNLASELIFRITGSTLHQFYEREIRFYEREIRKPLAATSTSACLSIWNIAVPRYRE
jgi:hypothetical protein